MCCQGSPRSPPAARRIRHLPLPRHHNMYSYGYSCFARTPNLTSPSFLFASEYNMPLICARSVRTAVASVLSTVSSSSVRFSSESSAAYASLIRSTASHQVTALSGARLGLVPVPVPAVTDWALPPIRGFATATRHAPERPWPRPSPNC